MKRLWGSLTLCALCALLLLAGCVPEETPPPPPPEPAAPEAPDTESFVLAWKEIAKQPSDAWGEEELRNAIYIVQQLAAQGPDAMRAVLDVLGDPEATPSAKLLVVISFTPQIRPEFAEALIAYTAEDQDQTTRSCAAHLLSLIDSPEANARLRALMHDESRHTRMATFLALLTRGDEQAVALVDQVWADPESTVEERRQLVFGLPEKAAQDHLTLFQEAIAMPALEAEARTRALTMLGRYGDHRVIEALQYCALKDQEMDIRVLAQRSLEALESRLKPTSAETPATPK